MPVPKFGSATELELSYRTCTIAPIVRIVSRTEVDHSQYAFSLSSGKRKVGTQDYRVQTGLPVVCLTAQVVIVGLLLPPGFGPDDKCSPVHVLTHKPRTDHDLPDPFLDFASVVLGAISKKVPSTLECAAPSQLSLPFTQKRYLRTCIHIL